MVSYNILILPESIPIFFSGSVSCFSLKGYYMNKKINSLQRKTNIKELTLLGLMTAILCIFAPLSLLLPISPVPISLATFAIYLCVYLLGARRGAICCIMYFLIGLIGIPVFSSFAAGPAVLLGPTGGYLIGYLFIALIGGLFIDRWPTKPLWCFAGLLLGTGACYAMGTLWLAYQAGITLPAALAAGVLPFIPGDLVKMILVLLIAPQIRKLLNRAGFLLHS